ncbi:hypothetical protein KAI04_04115 [Candidatus Pacearchaeota archaeon]|nr:hypothetical protein [Candidatus Pacearchaeota archaeon]
MKLNTNYKSIPLQEEIEDEREFEEMKVMAIEPEEYKLKYIKMEHKSVIYKQDGTEVIGDVCNGKVYWEEVLEGYCCTECDMSTSIK